ncbi:hypothetical protein NDU88_005105 [Pleurodeles waltl]|uniref:Uncharacterized protein n=1 Tax=Pleurodeles waltl TaxID=8319 RepID=A0AAV7T9N0_PLEWA|nr:hypothetical protein NDU88_005105 [Pleurodeles waltl]
MLEHPPSGRVEPGDRCRRLQEAGAGYGGSGRVAALGPCGLASLRSGAVAALEGDALLVLCGGCAALLTRRRAPEPESSRAWAPGWRHKPAATVMDI